MTRANPLAMLRQVRRWPFIGLLVALALPVGATAYALIQQFQSTALRHVPSNVAWTDETIRAISKGNALRGLLLAKRCEHCHGSEGFSATAATPNLAGMDKLVTWKQMQDFIAHKRTSPVMQPVAALLSQQDIADLAVYYSILPAYPDPQDNRSFPQTSPQFSRSSVAARLIVAGDGSRGIPPCQACHGPVAYRKGAPALAVQNSDYIFDQLEAFASGARANDINLPMRIIASQLTPQERHALAEYYGSGQGLLPAGATPPN